MSGSRHLDCRQGSKSECLLAAGQGILQARAGLTRMCDLECQALDGSRSPNRILPTPVAADYSSALRFRTPHPPQPPQEGVDADPFSPRSR